MKPDCLFALIYISTFILINWSTGQLVNADSIRTRTLYLTGDESSQYQQVGIVYLPVPHQANTQSSDEEVAAIVAAIKSLVGRKLVCEDGSERTVSLSDMLFVAPYNAQVIRLQQALGEQTRVGSVDCFQGQDAPIVFLCMCSSDAASSQRGLSFLFDRNRLNVAVSRAETLCVVVGHPRFAVTPVGTVADLKRVIFVAAMMG